MTCHEHTLTSLFRFVLLASALAAPGAFAQSSASAPPGAATGGVVTDPGLAELAGQLARLAERQPHRDSAEQALAELRDALLRPLADACRSDDLEVRTRSRSTLRKLQQELRLVRIKRLLPPEMRDRLVAFQQQHPDILDDLLDDRLPIRIRAVRRIGEFDDPQGLAEPLLALCVRHPSVELAGWAAHVSARNVYGHPLLVNALCEVIHNQASDRVRWQAARFADNQNDPNAPPNLWDAALQALRVLANPRTAEPIAQALDSLRNFDVEEHVELAEALGATRSLDIVPRLIQELKPGHNFTRNSNGMRTTFSPSDAYLLALLRLTGQGLSDYNLVYLHDPNVSAVHFGFTNDAARKRAQQQFRDWWAGPAGEAFRKTHGIASRPVPSGPATTEPPAPPASLPDAQATLARARQTAATLETRAREVLAEFRSDHFRKRRAATETYLRLARSLAETSAGSHSDVERIGDWIARLRVETFALQLHPETWTALQNGLLKTRPDLLAKYFSFSPEKRLQALEWLAKNDTDGLAEPIIADALAGTAKYLQFRAAKVTLKGQYRSDRVVDALADLAIPRNADSNQFRIHYWRDDDSSINSLALNALQAIGSPRHNDRLLKLAMKLPSFIPHTRVEDTLVACADRQLVEHLLSRLSKNTSRSSTLNTGKKRLTFSPTDRVLMLLLRITRQDPQSYGFTSLSTAKPFERYGFEDAKQRKAAVAKFREWWKAHQQEVFAEGSAGSGPPASQPAPRTRPTAGR